MVFPNVHILIVFFIFKGIVNLWKIREGRKLSTQKWKAQAKQLHSFLTHPNLSNLVSRNGGCQWLREGLLKESSLFFRSYSPGGKKKRLATLFYITMKKINKRHCKCGKMSPLPGNQRKANTAREKGPLLTSGISNDKHEWQGLVLLGGWRWGSLSTSEAPAGGREK